MASSLVPVFCSASAHPLPQHLGVGGVVLRDRDDLVGLCLAAAEDDVAVQVVAVGHRGPLEADEGREPARLVVLLRCGGDSRPGGSAQRIVALERIVQRVHAGDPFVVGIGALAGLDQVVHLLAPSGLQQFRVGGGDLRGQAQVLGMVGDHQEVQRALQPGRQAGARGHLFAAREAIRLFRAQAVADHAGVGGVRGVQVRVAEVHPVRKVLGRVWRIGDLLVRRAGRLVGPCSRAGGEAGQADARACKGRRPEPVNRSLHVRSVAHPEDRTVFHGAAAASNVRPTLR